MELRKFNEPEKEIENSIVKVDESDIESIINELKAIKPIKENIHKGHRSRLKSQFLQNGLTSLTDIQKLELLLFYTIPQKDTNPIAHNLLNKFGTLKDVLMARFEDLINVNGIKENSAGLITLINSFANLSHKPSGSEEICSSQAAIEYCEKLYVGKNVEEFYVICLNKSGKVKKCELVGAGTSDQVDVQIREISRIILENNVHKIILTHNHPYGSANPSDEDIRLTYSIMCSCLLNSVEILDHIIVGETFTISMFEANYTTKMRKKAVANVQLDKSKELYLSSISKEYIKSKEVHIEL